MARDAYGYKVSEEKGPGLGGLLKSFFKNRRNRVTDAPADMYEDRYAYPGQGGSESPVPIGFIRKAVENRGSLSPAEAARNAMENWNYMNITPLGPLQRMLGALGGDASDSPEDPSHIPFTPTEGLADPNFLTRQKYGS